MDAKLAVSLLRGNVGLGHLREDIAKFIEQHEYYAELGAAALKAANDPLKRLAPCSDESLQYINDNCAGRCSWQDFCKLRK